MGFFDLFKKNKKEEKIITGPIKCKVFDFLEIEKKLDARNEFLDVVVFRHNNEVHRIGNMFLNGKIVFQADGKTPAYIFDKDKYTSMDELIQATILKNEDEFIELLGFGPDEFDGPIDSIAVEDFYLDGEGEFFALKDN